MNRNLLNKVFKNLSPYVPGEQPQEKGFIKLNTNENPFCPPEIILDEIKKKVNFSLRKYPDPQAIELRKAIGQRYGFPPEWIFVGNGSDEILRLSFSAFSSVNEKIVFLYPSYPLYETISLIADRKPIKIMLKNDFGMPECFIDDFCDCMKVIANPDSPSGRFHPVEEIEKIAKATKKVLVIDEAYVDFALDNCLKLVKKFQNVIVSRSFSKSFSLAGIRLGYCFGNPELISALFAIKDSYNVNILSQAAGIAAMKNYGYVLRNCEEIIRNREFLAGELERLNFYVFPSSANFLLVRPPESTAKQLYEFLKQKKILVRYFENIKELTEFVRITVGNKEEIKRLLKCIKEFYAS
ncbi:MAG: histidinol-phosphate transaminase [Candidatus Omnitrophica bacterium]|nr:histidinol-phosphate transaminase [Candidatus Omnitrophota bacterium]